MAILPLVYYPDKGLEEACTAVGSVSNAHLTLLDDMLETMYAAKGIGLAAPQIGRSERITVIDVSSEGEKPIELINPEIIFKNGTIKSEEGCLSIPGFNETILRSEEIKVKALNRHGEEFEIEADGLLARCIQHEIDHLNGVLFIDQMSRLKKQLFQRWFKKNQPLGRDLE